MKSHQPSQKTSPPAPLAIAAGAFASGIWLAGHLQRSPQSWSVAALLLVVCALAAIPKRSLRLAQIAALLALIGAGAFARTYTPVPQVSLPPAEFLSGEPVEIIGHVTSDGAVLPGTGLRERFDLQAETMRVNGTQSTLPVGIRATVFSNDTEETEALAGAEFPRLSYGDRVKFTARLRTPRNFRNPGAFDYEGHLHGLGISTIATVHADKVEALPGKIGGRLGFWRSRIRRSILQHINDPATGLWDKQDAPLLAAMVVGDESALTRQVREEFQETGAYHLLVVSGMNVALLALAVFWLSRRLRVPEWAAATVTIALCVFYAYVAGLGAPVLRAVLMLSVYLLGRLLYRDRAALNATGFAALVVLVVSPLALFDAGFQLTFLALVAISGISLPLIERTSRPYRQALEFLDSTSYDLQLQPRQAQFRLDVRLVTERLARFLGRQLARFFAIGLPRMALSLYELFVVSAITQAVLVLPMRVYFHRAAIVGLPANLLVLPLAGVLLNSAVAAIALSYVYLPLGRAAGLVTTTVLHWTLRCLEALSHLHVSLWRIPDPNLTITLLAVGGIAIAVAVARRKPVFALCGVALLFVTAALAAFWRPAPRIEAGKLEITAIDVGQGDSLLVVSPDGHTLLIDAGGTIGPTHGEFDFGEDVISPYLWARGLDHLDVMALTHAHGDHIGGMARVVQNFHPRELWVGINPHTVPLDQLYESATINDVAVRKHTAGDTFTWGETSVRVLAPPPDWHTRSRPMNDDSLALLISYGNTRALLAGDVEKKIEHYIAQESPAADVLKVAHHGSATSTTPELLAAVHPRFAVISVGYRNSFGLPRQIVLDRLQDAHVRTYRTDTFGAVTFLLDGNKVEAMPASLH
ncbi:MAG TPA: ComEC/Rec2 family competence protein [Verrucomicrobiae bacterium]|jgi:competence protein ComEC|nr:ComEC/Rec2 family competence protein [Verrucomicrobiae bacterium]